MTFRRIASLVSLVASLAWCAPRSSIGGEPTAMTVRVRVVQRGSGKPVSGVKVAVRTPFTEPPDAAAFDEDGPLLPWLALRPRPEQGAAIVREAATGVDGIAPVKVPVDGLPVEIVVASDLWTAPRGRDLFDRRDPDLASPIDVPVVAAAVLEGTVVGPDDRPVADARVLVVPENAPDETGRVGEDHLPRGTRFLKTGERGEFHVGGLASGEVQVWAHAAGLVQDRRMTARRVTVRGGRTTSLPIALVRGRSVRGSVVDPEGRGVRGAVVGARPAPPTESPGAVLAALRYGVTRTDASGNFRLEDLGDDVHQVAVRARGFASPEAVRAEVPPGGDEAVATIRLLPGRTVAGRVLDAEGRPAAGARLRARAPGAAGRLFRWGACDAAGRFSLDGLPVGDFDLEAFLDVRTPARRSVTPDEGTVELSIPRDAQVEGRLVDARTKQPIRRFRVDGLRGASPDGRFHRRVESLDAPDAVSARFVLSAPGYVPVTLDRPRVAAGETKSLGDVELSPVTRVAGRVVDATTGEPVPGAIFVPLGLSSPWTEADGSFEIDTRGDDAVLQLIHKDYVPQEIHPQPTAEPLVVRMARGGSVEGAVPEGSVPAPGAAYVLLRSTTASPGVVEPGGKGEPVGADGRFSIRGVAAGTYRVSLYAKTPTGPAQETEAAREGSVVVVDGQTASVLWTAAAAAAGDGKDVRVTVVNADGTPAADARLLFDAGDGRWQDYPDAPTGSTFSLRAPSAPIRLRAVHRDWGLPLGEAGDAWASLVRPVKAGDAVTLTLDAAGPLVARVSGGKGTLHARLREHDANPTERRTLDAHVVSASATDGVLRFPHVRPGVPHTLHVWDETGAQCAVVDPLTAGGAEVLVSLEPVVPIEGTVKPVATAGELSRAVLWNDGMDVEAPIDAQGHFAIRSLPAGPWRLLLRVIRREAGGRALPYDLIVDAVPGKPQVVELGLDAVNSAPSVPDRAPSVRPGSPPPRRVGDAPASGGPPGAPGTDVPGGEERLALRDAAGALEAALARLAVEPNDARALRLQAEALRWKGDLDGALAAYAKIAAGDAGSAVVALGRARTLRAKGDAKGALAAVAAGVAANPKSADLLLLRSRLAEDRGDLTAALLDARAAVAAAPSDAWTHLRLWAVRVRSADRQPATTDLAKWTLSAPPVTPADAWPRRLVGLALGSVSYEDALAATRDAPPGAADAWRRERRCQVFYVDALQRLADGDDAAAGRRAAQAVGEISKASDEYASAVVLAAALRR